MGETRKPHRKTRTGCNQCKRRRVKCDEKKPSCTGCMKNNLKCSLEFLTPINSSSRYIITTSSPNLTPELSLSLFGTKTNELLHHYTTTLYLSLSDNQTPTVWKVAMLQTGLAHPYILSGIQAISALHLAILVPHREEELQRFAVTQALVALPTFQAQMHMNNPTLEIVNATIAFAGFIVYYIMASPEQYAGHRTRLPSRHDDHPHWFPTMRGLLALVMNHWHDLLNGPFRTLFDTLPPGSRNFSKHPGDEQFVKLGKMFSPVNSVDNARSIEICRQALKELRKASAVSYASSGIPSIKSSIHMWVGLISQDYVELIYERDPRALVILAHFCVILKRNHHVWYLRGLGTGTLESIRKELSEEWRPWIQWALEQPVSEKDAINS